jgi:hypothetical protein
LLIPRMGTTTVIKIRSAELPRPFVAAFQINQTQSGADNRSIR